MKPAPWMKRRNFVDHREAYPLGRKHCTRCGCWRPLSDFAPKEWTDETKTVVREVQPRCRPCANAVARERVGNLAPRRWYPHGKPGSKLWRQYEAERAKINYRFGRERRGLPIPDRGPTTERVRGNPRPFLGWVDKVQPGLSKEEAARVSRLRLGTLATVDLMWVDEIMTRNGCMIDFFLLYPLEEELTIAA